MVTALGHTSDRTVADLVGDAECRTPTEAGARVVPRKSDLQQKLADRRRRLDREIERRFRQETERLARAKAGIARLSPIRQLERREQHVRDQQRRLHAALGVRLRMSQARLTATGGRERMQRALGSRLAREEGRLEGQRQRLVALSPDSVLSRGYSITRDRRTGVILRTAVDAAVDQEVSIQLGSGGLSARVEEVRP